MPITNLPTPPTRQDPANFAERADTFLSALPDFVIEANELQAAVNLAESNAVNAANLSSANLESIESSIGATVWDPLTSYLQYSSAIDPVDLYTYRRKVAGIGGSRPGLNLSEWELISSGVRLSGDQSASGSKTWSGPATWSGNNQRLFTKSENTYPNITLERTGVSHRNVLMEFRTPSVNYYFGIGNINNNTVVLSNDPSPSTINSPFRFNMTTGEANFAGGLRVPEGATNDQVPQVQEIPGIVRGLIVGNVSQTGGLPTGSIIESDTNANGSYVKYADGTLICRRSIGGGTTNVAMGSLFVSSGVSGDWPAAFSSNPIVSATTTGSTGTHCWCGDITGNLTGFTNLRIMSVLNTATANVNLIAIGRWF